MRRTRSSIRIAALALLTTGLLGACSQHPISRETAARTLSPLAAPSLPGSYKYVHTLTGIPSGTTPAQLASLYGGLVLDHSSTTGTAVVANNSSTKGKYDNAIEANNKTFSIAEQGSSGWSTGYTAWSVGYTAWSVGYTAWSVGTTSAATTFSENTALWDVINLSGAQTLVPELGRGIKVAVIDSGIDLYHPAYYGKIDTANAKDYLDGDNVPQEVNGNTTGGYSNGYGHGTAVANVILQIAPYATILPLRVLDPSGNGDTATIAAAINYAVTAGAKIINLSLGTTQNSSAINQAISNAVSSGVRVVTAAVNSGDTNVLYPATPADGNNAQGVGSVGVVSVTSTNTKSSFSTYGNNLELSAPGENIKTAFPGSMTVTATGTSFSTAVVSGVLALALSTGATGTSSTAMAQLMTNLDATGRPSNDPTYGFQMGYGTVDAYALIRKYR